MMKLLPQRIITLALFLGLSVVTWAFSKPQNLSAAVTIVNPLDMARTDELVVLSREFLQKKIGKIANGQFALLSKKSGEPVLLQYDDLDDDGKWDEVAFLYSFAAKEKLVLELKSGDAPAHIKAVVRAHARHQHKNADDSFGEDKWNDEMPAGQPNTDFTKQKLPPFLTEGPAWENDKVGFRIYFDIRNMKDIWGKRTSRMVLDEVGKNPANTYHKLSDWGMDILKVGTSLGSGSLALEVAHNGKDTLVRLGGAEMGKVQYRKIADGPVRAIITLNYPDWNVLGKKVAVAETISIWGGQYFYESKVTVNRAPAHASLVTGIVNLHKTTPYNLSRSGQHILYSFDKQSDINDELGMAILVPEQSFGKYIKAPGSGTGITNTHIVTMPLSKSKEHQFRFYAAWSMTDNQFLSKDNFEKYLVVQALLKANPVSVQ